MRVDTDAADAAHFEEREDEVVISGVEVEVARDHVAGSLERGLRLLHGAHVVDPCERLDRGRLGIDDDAARDVVEDDRQVGRGGDRLNVRDDAALRGLVVVRRHDEHAVDTDLGRPFGQMDRVCGRVRTRPGHDGVRPAELRDGGLVQLEALPVGERRCLAGRARDDDAVGPVVDERAAERPERLEVE